MEIDYSALTTEEMETLVKNLNEQIEMKRTSVVEGMLREMYPYVAENSKLIKEIKKLPDKIRCMTLNEMENDFEELFQSDISYTEDLTLEDILALLRFAIESYHNNI